MLHIINICFGVFCICSPRKYFIFQTGVLDTHPARAPQPSCAWECHQLNEKQRWREKDLLGGSLQGPQRSDSARWMQQDFFFGGGGMLDGGVHPAWGSVHRSRERCFGTQRCHLLGEILATPFNRRRPPALADTYSYSPAKQTPANVLF